MNCECELLLLHALKWLRALRFEVLEKREHAESLLSALSFDGDEFWPSGKLHDLLRTGVTGHDNCARSVKYADFTEVFCVLF